MLPCCLSYFQAHFSPQSDCSRSKMRMFLSKQLTSDCQSHPWLMFPKYLISSFYLLTCIMDMVKQFLCLYIDAFCMSMAWISLPQLPQNFFIFQLQIILVLCIYFIFSLFLLLSKLCARIKKASAKAVKGGQSSYAGLAEVHGCHGEKSLGSIFFISHYQYLTFPPLGPL